MARLPTVGGDADSWGTLLNDFLLQGHRPDGLLKGTCEHFNVRDYGAVGDGAQDDTDSFQDALDAAGGANGATVFAPPGVYRINGNLSVPPHVTLRGVFGAPTAWSQNKGTTLLAFAGRNNADGTPFITLNGVNAGVQGLTIFYPEQNNENDIVPYPWTVRGGSGNFNDNVSVQDVLLVNPYQGVDFGTYACGRHLIRNLYGQPLSLGIRVDQCLDVGRIENVHFWPFWKLNALNTMATPTGNARALVLGRTDWQIVHNFFAFGYHVGVQFTTGLPLSGSGTAIGGNGQFTNLNLDAMNVGLDVYAISTPGFQISNLNLVCSGTYGQPTRRGIWIHDSGNNVGPLSIHNASFWGGFNGAIIRSEKGGPFSLMGATLRNWTASAAAIELVGGRATIQGNLFQDAIGKSVLIGPGCDRIIVTGNHLVGNPIDNQHAGLQMIANNL